MIQDYLNALAVVALAWIGSMEIRMRNMNTRAIDAPSRAEMKEEIDARSEASKAILNEIQKDIHRIEKKLDKIT